VLISAASITSNCVEGGGSFFSRIRLDFLTIFAFPHRVVKKFRLPRGYSKDHHPMEGSCIIHGNPSIVQF
jgi:hypothetical protein